MQVTGGTLCSRIKMDLWELFPIDPQKINSADGFAESNAWLPGRDSNPRQGGKQPPALPAELPGNILSWEVRKLESREVFLLPRLRLARFPAMVFILLYFSAGFSFPPKKAAVF